MDSRILSTPILSKNNKFFKLKEIPKYKYKYIPQKDTKISDEKELERIRKNQKTQ